MPLPLTPERTGERKTLAEMFGEFLCECAALVAVFAILDKLVAGESVSVWWLIAAWSIAGGSLAAGMALERRRKR
jgi:hypothetical protein